jgi:hypothetical protein
MVDDFRVIIGGACIYLVPGVTLKPTQPIASSHVRIVGMTPVSSAKRPLRRQSDDLFTQRDAGPERRTSAEKENRLAVAILQEERTKPIDRLHLHLDIPLM